MLKKLPLLLIFTFWVSACNNSDSDNLDLNFDRSALLINWADNIIIPAYNSFKDNLAELQSSSNEFKNNINENTLELLREKWIKAYKSWQHIEMFNIGKAEEIYYASKMNVYPADIIRINSNIESGNYDFNNANNNSAQGFPTLDYLLYFKGSDGTQVIDKFLSTEGDKHMSYLINVVNQMVINTEIVVNDWPTYRDTFVKSTENTATSSVNKLTNDFIFYYEKGLRANKIGIPAGIFSAAPITENVEAYYNQNISKILILEAIDAVHNFFLGKAFNSNSKGDSFKTIIETLTNNTESNLGNIIDNKLSDAKTKINDLNENFVTQIESDNTTFLRTYDAIQEVVVLLKVDMLQVLNINVDYADADGD